MKPKAPIASEDLRAEYKFDYSKAVRGKYYKRVLSGSNVVVLEPDVARGFKTAAAVNKVLRAYLKSNARKQGPGRKA